MSTREESGPSEPLLTRRFVVVVLSGTCYFGAIGVLLPIVPRYVEHRLGGGDVDVGAAVGALALGAILLRPLAGRMGDRFGRRVLMIGGAAIVGAMALCAGLVPSLGYLIATRVVMGLGEAAFFVGGTTMATDLAPVARRGEAVSYWSVAVWGGLSLGPVLGEGVLAGSHYDRVWITAGMLGFAAALIALATTETRGDTAPGRGRLIHPAAVRPGVLLAATLVGIVGFNTFLPLYAPEVGVGDVGLLFLAYGIVVLGVRIFGARLPDQLGPIRAGTIAMGATTAGLAVIAAWHTTAGLVLGAMMLAVGASFLYPALLLFALSGVPEGERGSVVGTFSAFFDFASGAGGVVLGTIAALSSYQGAFGFGALLALVAFVLLRTGFGHQARGPVPAIASLDAAAFESDPFL